MRIKATFLLHILFVLVSFSLDATISLRLKKNGKQVERQISLEEHQNIKKKYRDVGVRSDENKKEHPKELFKTSFLKQFQKVRSFISKPPQHSLHCKANIIEVVCDKSYRTEIYFFDRKSDTLLVASPGFGFAKEIMTSFVEMFPQYDILLLEQRGHGASVLPETKMDQVVCSVLGLVPSLITWGQKEPDDLNTIVSTIRKDRHTKVVGLGFCYSSLILSQAQKKYPNLFTHLIFDGTIVSLAKTFRQIKEETGLISQVFPLAGYSHFIPDFDLLMKKSIDCLAALAQGSTLYNDVSFASLRVPVLIWYGKKDLLVPFDDFELLWDALSVNYKVALVTDNRHLVNHLKEKELYRWSVELFLNQKIA
ncbi:hypothetical protein JKY79_00045 [Candidatus Babeliales bacterium]|nr:hypothetical protein [Candidatus Babeliales bacterium]